MTLAELRTLARQRADQENSSFISDSEANNYINMAYGELYDLLVASFSDYYLTSTTFTLSGTNNTTLPADFYKIRGLDFNAIANSYVTVQPFNFLERNRFDVPVSKLAWGVQRRQYRVMGNKIYLIPEQDVDGTYRLWYIPRYTRLSADGDQMSNVLDFEEYVIVSAAIMMMNKEESDPSALLMMKQALKDRIDGMAKDRDAGQGERVGDVTGYEVGYDRILSGP